MDGKRRTIRYELAGDEQPDPASRTTSPMLTATSTGNFSFQDAHPANPQKLPFNKEDLASTSPETTLWELQGDTKLMGAFMISARADGTNIVLRWV